MKIIYLAAGFGVINQYNDSIVYNDLLVGAHTEQPQLLINGPKLIKCVLQEAGSTVDSLLTQAEYWIDFVLQNRAVSI